MAKAAAETVAVKVGVTVAEVRAVAARAVEVMGGEAMVMEGAAMVEATVAKSIAWAEDVKEEREEHLAVAST